MFEDSVEAFMARWRPYAADLEVFARPEGQPLLECRAGGAVIQVFERTGPYLAGTGKAVAILNVTVEQVVAVDGPPKKLESTGLAKLHARGLVLASEPPFLVVDAGVPLVVGLLGEPPAGLGSGSWVEFEAQPPVHCFVLSQPRRVEVRAADGEAP